MKMNKEVVMVKLSDIIPNRFQPRLTFDEEALNDLASSIREHGIIQPLILRDLGSKYEIIAGERRYKAATIAGLAEVPAIVGSMDDQTSAELALIENIQRKDLTAIEEAKSYLKIQEMGNLTQTELAKRMGKSQPTIANKMRLLSLTNEVQVALMNNLISERHARCLLQIKDEDKQKEVLNKIITERMNVRDTDDYIKNLLGITKEELPSKKEEINPNPVENTTIPIIDLGQATSKEEPSNNEALAPLEVPLDSSTSATIDISSNNEVKDSIPVDITENKETENPNVYMQDKNTDFVDISSLSSDEKSLSVEETNKVKEEKDKEGESLDMPIDSSKEDNNLSKLKYATAIKIAKDSLETIKMSGYNVSLEENENDTEYQIIIKVQK